MGVVILALILIAGFALWALAFVRISDKRGKKGVQLALISLIGMLLLDGFLFLIIVVPVQNCTGFLCGLGEILLFLALAALLFIITPIILLVLPGTREDRSRSEVVIDKSDTL